MLATAMSDTIRPTLVMPSQPLELAVLCGEPVTRQAYRELGESAGFHVQECEREEQLWRTLERHSPDAILLDRLEQPLEPKGDHLASERTPTSTGSLVDLVREIKARRSDIEVLIVSAAASVSHAVQAVREGAFEYMSSPVDVSEMSAALDRLQSHLAVRRESRAQRERLRTRHGYGGLVGHADEMQRLYRMIAKAAGSTHPVLVLGESGTGKELVARCIHNSGPNRDKPFIAVDCGSLVPTLIESELFGYVKGAFTGANRTKEGLLAIAHGGTVFLDEIGELPADLQAKLLRALQEKEIRPVGSTHTVKIDVRILAATNRDLELAVESGAFRKDLFYRLNVLSLRIPPLRERRQDVRLLTEHFLDRLGRGSTAVGGGARSISPEAMELLMAYDWPGNVRELENCLERAYALNSGPTLHVADLPSAVRNAREARLASSASTDGRILPIAELEKRAILQTLEQLNNDKMLAARMLGIGKTTLYRKLKEYGIS